MKVQPTNSIKQTRRTQPVSRQDAKESREEDRVSTSKRNRLDEVKQAAQRTGEQQHAERLRQLEEQIKMGTYRPDPGRIAAEILRAAELQAQISAVLN